MTEPLVRPDDRARAADAAGPRRAAVGAGLARLLAGARASLGVFAVLALFDLLPGLPGLAACRASCAVRGSPSLPRSACGAAHRAARRLARSGRPRAAASSRRAGCRTGRCRRSADRPSGAARRRRAAAVGGASAAHGGGDAPAARRLAGCRPGAARSVGRALGSGDPAAARPSIDAGADWRDRARPRIAPSFAGAGAAVAASFDLWVTPPEYTGLAPQFLRAGDSGDRCRSPTGSMLLAQVHGGGARAAPRDRRRQRAISQPIDKQNFRIEATLTAGKELSADARAAARSAAGRSRSSRTTRRQSPSPSRPKAPRAPRCGSTIGRATITASRASRR